MKGRVVAIASVIVLCVGLAQCQRKAEVQAQPPPAVASAMPEMGVVEVQAPKRVIPVTRTGETGETLKTVFASVVLRNGLAVPIEAAVVGCRLIGGKLLVGELPEPLPAGASTGVPAWPVAETTIDQPGGLLPVLEACGATSIVAGGRQALAPHGQLPARFAETEFKDLAQ